MCIWRESRLCGAYRRGGPKLAALLAGFVALCACLPPAGAQPLEPIRQPQFRADTNLILVPVTVTDGRGSNIEGLSVDSFSVLDNRHPQPIAAFYRSEERRVGKESRAR